MPNKYTIQTDIDLVNTLRIVTQVYQEIAVMKMQRIRTSVLVTRQFLNKLAEIFYDVKRSYKKEIERLMKDKKINYVSKKNGKTVSVLLSPNTKLYGDIVFKVFRNFIHGIEKNDSEIMIVGRLGKELYDERADKRDYTYFEIPDSDIRIEDLRAIIYHIVDYENVNIFYGKFENIVVQNASMANISGDDPNRGVGLEYRERAYLFEPSLEKILDFFQTQMITSLFKQTVHESQLARFASRIRAMEEAIGNIDVRSRELSIEARKIRKLIENKKQVETLSGISLWSK